jgi:hypothetical protein
MIFILEKVLKTYYLLNNLLLLDLFKLKALKELIVNYESIQ